VPKFGENPAFSGTLNFGEGIVSTKENNVMSDPTTKAELVTRMRRGHQDFYNLLARIPDERMTDIALYDA